MSTSREDGSIQSLAASCAILAGLIVNPAWYVWLGLTLRNGRR